MKPCAKELRKLFLEKKIEKSALDSDFDKAKIIKQISKEEEMKDIFREIRAATTTRSGQVNHIEVKNENGKGSRTIYEKEDMEKAMLRVNKSKYMEIHDTPPLLEPLKSILGPAGLSSECDLILKGTFRLPPCVHPDIIEFVSYLKMDDKIKQAGPIKQDMDTKFFQKYWKPSREKVQSSFSGIHNGHYVAATMNRYICCATALLCSIPWLIGHPLQRWRQSLNVELEKRSGERRLDKLRTIHLLKACFQQGTKTLLGQGVMKNARKHRQIPESQYATKKKKGTEAVLVKRLYYDLLRIMKIPGAVIANDAKGCYDRMSLAIGSLCLRRLGTPLNILSALFITVINMRHYVRSGLGDSTSYYTSERDKYLQGGGQGNGSGPPTWLAISVVLLNIIADYPINAMFVSAVLLISITMSAIMYVDDTDVLLTGGLHETRRQLSTKAQKLTNKWCTMLRMTGGALRPDKCWWFLIMFKWRPDGSWRYANVDESMVDLTMPDHNNNVETVDRFESHEGKMGLGIYLAPDGNNKKQVEYMKDKTTEWCNKIKSPYMSVQAMYVALFITIFATLKYPLVALTLTMKECEKIMIPVYQTALPRIGVN